MRHRRLDSDDPIGKFFDFDNIAFSHISCNIKASRNWGTPGQEPPNKDKGKLVHGKLYGYEGYRCRCDACKKVYSEYRKKRYKRTGK